MAKIKFRLKDHKYKTFITIECECENACALRELRDNILSSSLSYMQLELERIDFPKHWLPEDCD